MNLKILFILLMIKDFSTLFADAQLVTMFGNAVQAENCAKWGPWGECIWLKGDEPRWQNSYFEQLSAGRQGCQGHMFFRLLRERWGQAMANVVDYLRGVTLSRNLCGFCSYQQSCGRKCNRRGNPNSMNALFVAERLCPDVDQSSSCEFAPIEGSKCTFWPNPSIQLPNVSESMLNLVNSIQFLNCIPQKTQNGVEICRCCCSPFAPNPWANFRCEIPTFNGTDWTMNN